MSSVEKIIARIEKDLESLKLHLAKQQEKQEKAEKKEPKKKKAKDVVKPESISDCKSKKELDLFTVPELKKYCKENEIPMKDAKNKENYVKVIGEHLGEFSETESVDSGVDSSKE
jgi:ribosomal protein S19